jgi:subtilisin family serine protease
VSGPKKFPFSARLAVALVAAALLFTTAAPSSAGPPIDDAASAVESTSVRSGTDDAVERAGTLYNLVDQIGARSLWERGTTGAGVDVAIIDTGISPVPALSGEDKVAAVVDFSFEAGDPRFQYLDTNGHGTHLAGIIAGSDPGGDPATAAERPSEFQGVAPGARLVGVKVADNQGAVDVSQVIAAIDWVVENRNAGDLDIRVLNLAYGTDSEQDYTIDPLTAAVERAWRAGIVVVASTGNAGDSRVGLDNPARDPYIISVGAVDLSGDDAVVPDWSSGGGDGLRSPDLVAPGVSVESLRVPGSRVATENPQGRVSETILKGSGSSQSAAVVSGAVALLLEERPELTPDQVKDLLVSSADSIDDTDTSRQGAGVLDVAAAVELAPTDEVQDWPEATGTGSLDLSRGSARVSLDGEELTGEQTVWDVGAPVGTAALWNGWTWSGWTWSGWTWSGWTWSGWTWSGWTWSGWTWSGWTWSGWTWSGWTWSGWTWSGWTWSGWTWSGWTWSGWTWSGWTWS